MKRAVTVTIAGQRYSLRSDAEDREVRALAEYVDGKIREVQRHTKTPDTASVAVLTALQIAEELFALRRAEGELRRKVRDKGRAILEYLEREARV